VKIAHYIGRHQNDDIFTRIGWACTRAVQRGNFKQCTHVEAILAEHEDGEVTIASSSLRDNGVRAKKTKLSRGSWIIADVPQWQVQKSANLLSETYGAQYDLFGAFATVFPTRQNKKKFFCTEWVAYPYLQSPHIFGPAQFAAITLSIGQDITEQFFAGRSD
jgi:hypothetical protein